MASVIDSNAQNSVSIAPIAAFSDSTPSKVSHITKDFKILHRQNEKQPTLDGEDHDLNKITSRPVMATTFNFSTADVQNQVVFSILPDELIFSNPMVLQKYNKFKYLHTKIVMEFRFNPQSFQQGIYAVSQMPGYQNRKNMYDFLLTDNVFKSTMQATSLPTEIINFNHNNLISSDSPYYSTAYAYDMVEKVGSFGRVLVWCLSPLKQITSSVNNLLCQVFIHFVNPKVTWPTGEDNVFTPPSLQYNLMQNLLANNFNKNSVNSPINLLPLNSTQDEHESVLEKRKKNSALSAIAVYQSAQNSQVNLNTDVTYPRVNARDNFVNVIKESAGNILDAGVNVVHDAFGFSKHLAKSDICYANNVLMNNINNYNGTYNSHMMGLSYGNTLGKYDLQCNGTDSFEYITQRPVHIQTIKITTTTEVGILASFKLDPWMGQKISGFNNLYSLPPASKIAQNFMYCQMGHYFQIYVAGTSFHKFRMRFFYEPSTTASPNSIPGSNLVKTAFYDFDPKKTHYDFACEYSQNCPFMIRKNTLLSTDPNDRLNTAQPNDLTAPNFNGYFKIELLIPLSCPPSVEQSVELLVFMSNTNCHFMNNICNPMCVYNEQQYPPFGSNIVLPENDMEIDSEDSTIDEAPTIALSKMNLNEAHGGLTDSSFASPARAVFQSANSSAIPVENQPITSFSEDKIQVVPNINTVTPASSAEESENKIDPVSADIVEQGELINETSVAKTTLYQRSPLQNDSVLSQSGGELISSYRGLFTQSSLFVELDKDIVMEGDEVLFIIPDLIYANYGNLTLDNPTMIDNLDKGLGLFLSARGSLDITMDFSSGFDIATRYSVYKCSDILDPSLKYNRVDKVSLSYQQKMYLLNCNHQYDAGGFEGTLSFTSPFMSPYPFVIPTYNTYNVIDRTNTTAQAYFIVPTHNPFDGYTIPKGTKIFRRFGRDFELGPFISTTLDTFVPPRQ